MGEVGRTGERKKAWVTNKKRTGLWTHATERDPGQEVLVGELEVQEQVETQIREMNMRGLTNHSNPLLPFYFPAAHPSSPLLSTEHWPSSLSCHTILSIVYSRHFGT